LFLQNLFAFLDFDESQNSVLSGLSCDDGLFCLIDLTVEAYEKRSAAREKNGNKE
jgi:hypothetical protein